jgi:hypothetical protein
MHPNPERPAKALSYQVTFEFADPRVSQLSGYFIGLANLFISDRSNCWSRGNLEHRKETDRTVSIISWEAHNLPPSIERQMVVERAVPLLFEWFREQGLVDIVPIYAGAKKLTSSAENELIENCTDKATTLFSQLQHFEEINTVDFS